MELPDASDLFNRRGQSPERVGVLDFQHECPGGTGVCRGGLWISSVRPTGPPACPRVVSSGVVAAAFGCLCIPVSAVCLAHSAVSSSGRVAGGGLWNPWIAVWVMGGALRVVCAVKKVFRGDLQGEALPITSAVRRAVPNQSLKRDGTALAWFSRSGRFTPSGRLQRRLDCAVPPLSLVLGPIGHKPLFCK